MSKRRGGTRRLSALLALVAAAACTDRPGPLSPVEEPRPPVAPTPADPVDVAVLDCTASITARTVECAPAPPEGATGPQALIVGGQNVYVRLASTNVGYNSGTGLFTFDATVQNLIPQPLGTADGTTLDPAGVRIFFHGGPSVTGGTGVAAVIPDGFADFTATGQPFYQYNQVLARNQVSSAKQWRFVVSPTVTNLVFQLYVSTAVEYPDGYVELNGQLPGASLGALHPGSAEPLTAVVRNVVGTAVPGPVTFSSSDPLCATVTPVGEVTGVRAATCSITATAGTRTGEAVFNVTGTTRLWSGAASADWSNAANWSAGLVPADADSVSIPTGVPNYPALTSAVQVGGVTVADGATLSLASFPLVASADVATGATPGSGIVASGGTLVLAGAGGTVRGRVPSLQVTGTYSLSGNLFVVAPETIDGSVTSELFEMQVVAQ